MGNIIGNKVFVGNYEASKIYLGDILVYVKGLLFSMPSYNNTVPYVNSFGAVTFTGGTDVDGWIAPDLTVTDGKNQRIIITPYPSSLVGKFLMTVQIARVAPSLDTSSTIRAIEIRSDIMQTSGSESGSPRYVDVFVGVYPSSGADQAEYRLDGNQYLIEVMGNSDRLYELGCYVDTVTKRCYIGSYTDYSRIPGTSDHFSIKTTHYVPYSSSFDFNFVISTILGTSIPVNYIRDIKVRKVSNIDMETGSITYL